MRVNVAERSRLRLSKRLTLVLTLLAFLVAFSTAVVGRLFGTSSRSHTVHFAALPRDVATQSFLIAKNGTEKANGWYRINVADQTWTRITDEPFYTKEEYSAVCTDSRALLYRLTVRGVERYDIKTGNLNIVRVRSSCTQIVYLPANNGFHRFECDGKRWCVQLCGSASSEAIRGCSNLARSSAVPWLMVDAKQVVFVYVDAIGTWQFVLCNLATGDQVRDLRIKAPFISAAPDETGPRMFTLTSEGNVIEYDWTPSGFVDTSKFKLPGYGSGDVFQRILAAPKMDWLPYQVFEIDASTGRPAEHVYVYNLKSGATCDPIKPPEKYADSEYVDWFCVRPH